MLLSRSLRAIWAAVLVGLLAPASAQAPSVAVPAATAASGPVPLEVFFTPAPLRSATLSPSGRWLAVVAQSKNERARLVIVDLDHVEPAKGVALFTRLDVGSVQWVNDDWLVFNTSDVVDRGSERRGPGLMSIRRDGERIRLLIKREYDSPFPPPGSQPLEVNHRMLGLGASGSDEILVGEYLYDSFGDLTRIAPFALNVATGGRRTLVDKMPPDTVGWVFDSKGRARSAISVKGKEETLRWYDLATGEWRVIGRYPRLSMEMVPRFVDAADHLYVDHYDRGGFSLLSRFDLSTGQPEREPLVSTPGFSGAIGAIQNLRDGTLVGANVVTDASAQAWFTPQMKAIQAKIDARLPGRVNLLGCGSCDNPPTVLVISYTERDPAEYLLYRPASDKWERIGRRMPDVDPMRMAGVELHRTKARDGRDLPVWITRRVEPGAAAGPKPAVVLVHGGPWVRGSQWRWDAEAQFLASRGYVVIEPEFRGSTGYGDAHYRAGWKQWGRAMQDDVTDALRFAVKSGWVDEKRVCIAGASYGGYATLMGLARDPELYRCGVAWTAVSDPKLMFSIHWSDISDDSKAHTMPQLMGDPEKDAAMLAANSPLVQAARIKAPVFLAYGGRDRRVPIEHGERMRDALTRSGNPPEWRVYDDEGHGWARPETQLDFWRRVEGFLAKHLAP
jgi:dienelactone hydrolase